MCHELWWPEVTHLKTTMCKLNGRWWSGPQFKTVNHWQYSMTLLATLFLFPFFHLLPLPPFLPSSLPCPSLLFLHHLPWLSPILFSSLLSTSVPPTFNSSSLLPHSFTFFSPSPLSPKLSVTFHNGLSNILHLHIYQRWFENQSVYNIATPCLWTIWLLPTNVIELLAIWLVDFTITAIPLFPTTV